MSLYFEPITVTDLFEIMEKTLKSQSCFYDFPRYLNSELNVLPPFLQLQLVVLFGPLLQVNVEL
jgi:hypothetical protein